MIPRICLIALLLSGCAAMTEAGRPPIQPSTPIEAGLILPLRQASGGPVALQAPIPDSHTERLERAIGHYRAIAAQGGWKAVPAGKPLKEGAEDPRVAALKARLVVTGELAEMGHTPELFDSPLTSAVKLFQARHGLEADGAVGRATLEELNVPIAQRIATLELILGKLASQEPTWGSRYIAINIAEASFTYVDGDKIITGPVIVGQKSWQTPELDSVIDRIDLNPGWTVPVRIAAAEIWPKVKKDPNYLAQHNMRVIDGKVFQKPGRGNPLGQVKFSFNNPYSVYLHDTNHPELFASAMRYRSHGCVRVSDPMTLAKALILENPDWTEERIADALKRGSTTRVVLQNPIPVHIVYNTAWVSKDGTIHFRPDAYQRNGKAQKILTEQALDAE